MYQEHESQITGTTSSTFYGQMMSDQIKAEESAAVVALELLSTCCGFEINDYNYREAQFQMMRARQAERRVRTIEVQRATKMHALRNVCNQATEFRPAAYIYSRSEDTTYAGPAPPRTREKMLAFGLSNIIPNVVQPNVTEE